MELSWRDRVRLTTTGGLGVFATPLATGDTTALPTVEETGPLPVIDPELLRTFLAFALHVFSAVATALAGVLWFFDRV